MNLTASIAPYIKEIGRGKEGARNLTRAQAADLLGLVLDRQVSDLEVGAFCLAMRIKGESTDELLGFLDAIHERLPALSLPPGPWVVLPSYNGARKLPLLTPLLAGLLAQAHPTLNVLVHGMPEDPARTTSAQVWQALGWNRNSVDFAIKNAAACAGFTAQNRVFFIETSTLLPSLAWLLNVRRTVGLRNSAHSLVKLMNPLIKTCPGALVVGSYTHPEYLESMGAVFAQTPYPAMLMRGTEGEPVADPRRSPRMEVFSPTTGSERSTQTFAAQEGALATLPQLPRSTDAAAAAAYTQAVLAGQESVPAPLALQVERLLLALPASGA